MLEAVSVPGRQLSPVPSDGAECGLESSQLRGQLPAASASALPAAISSAQVELQI